MTSITNIRQNTTMLFMGLLSLGIIFAGAIAFYPTEVRAAEWYDIAEPIYDNSQWYDIAEPVWDNWEDVGSGCCDTGEWYDIAEPIYETSQWYDIAEPIYGNSQWYDIAEPVWDNWEDVGSGCCDTGEWYDIAEPIYETSQWYDIAEPIWNEPTRITEFIPDTRVTEFIPDRRVVQSVATPVFHSAVTPIRHISAPVVHRPSHTNISHTNISNVSSVNTVHNVQTHTPTYAVAQPQPIIVNQQPPVYYPPTYRPPIYQQPEAVSCTLTLTRTGYGQNMLTWTTYGATRALINNGVGNVNVGSGSRTIPAVAFAGSQYVMTVWSPRGHSTTCVAGGGFVPQRPHVTVDIAHVPYTGVDPLPYVLGLLATMVAGGGALFVFRHQIFGVLVPAFANVYARRDENEEEAGAVAAYYDAAVEDDNVSRETVDTLAVEEGKGGPKLSFIRR